MAAKTAERDGAKTTRNGGRRSKAAGSAPPDRREQLLEAARAAFIEKGYDATKVSDIVQRAGLAQGTFYLYFESKLAVMLAVSAEVTKGFYSSGVEAFSASADFASGIDDAVSSVLHLARKQRDVIAVMHQGRVVNAVQAQNSSVRVVFHTSIVEFVKRAMSDDMLPGSADADMVADLCVAVVDAGIQAIAHDEAASVPALSREISAFLKRALGIRI